MIILQVQYKQLLLETSLGKDQQEIEAIGMHRYDWFNQQQNNDNAASTNRKALLESSFNQQQIMIIRHKQDSCPG